MFALNPPVNKWTSVHLTGEGTEIFSMIACIKSEFEKTDTFVRNFSAMI